MSLANLLSRLATTGRLLGLRSITAADSSDVVADVARVGAKKGLVVEGVADGTPVVVSGSVTATGGATEATLATLSAKVTACNTAAVGVTSSALPAGAATEATLATLSGKVTACNTGSVTVTSCALPTGAATQTTLAAVLAILAIPTKHTDITKSNDTPLDDIANVGVIIGGAGTLVYRTSGTSGTSANLPVVAGQFVPGQFTRVMAATTATGIVGVAR
jgi:hypothetical protein